MMATDNMAKEDDAVITLVVEVNTYRLSEDEGAIIQVPSTLDLDDGEDAEVFGRRCDPDFGRDNAVGVYRRRLLTAIDDDPAHNKTADAHGVAVNGCPGLYSKGDLVWIHSEALTRDFTAEHWGSVMTQAVPVVNLQTGVPLVANVSDFVWRPDRELAGGYVTFAGPRVLLASGTPQWLLHQERRVDGFVFGMRFATSAQLPSLGFGGVVRQDEMIYAFGGRHAERMVELVTLIRDDLARVGFASRPLANPRRRLPDGPMRLPNSSKSAPTSSSKSVVVGRASISKTPRRTQLQAAATVARGRPRRLDRALAAATATSARPDTEVALTTPADSTTAACATGSMRDSEDEDVSADETLAVSTPDETTVHDSPQILPAETVPTTACSPPSKPKSPTFGEGISGHDPSVYAGLFSTVAPLPLPPLFYQSPALSVDQSRLFDTNPTAQMGPNNLPPSSFQSEAPSPSLSTFGYDGVGWQQKKQTGQLQHPQPRLIVCYRGGEDVAPLPSPSSGHSDPALWAAENLTLPYYMSPSQAQQAGSLGSSPTASHWDSPCYDKLFAPPWPPLLQTTSSSSSWQEQQLRQQYQVLSPDPCNGHWHSFPAGSTPLFTGLEAGGGYSDAIAGAVDAWGWSNGFHQDLGGGFSPQAFPPAVWSGNQMLFQQPSGTVDNASIAFPGPEHTGGGRLVGAQSSLPQSSLPRREDTALSDPETESPQKTLS